MPTDIIKWIEINWKVLIIINDNRSIIGSTEVGCTLLFVLLLRLDLDCNSNLHITHNTVYY
jgi:hypothetical protein